MVIPTFNRVDLLIERALSSVLAQTYRNWEVIVAAHGCTDDTVRRVREINDRLQKGQNIGVGGLQRGFDHCRSTFTREIRVIDVPRVQTYPESPENHWFAGPVAPINAALQQVRGEWIARIDDDDSWSPGCLETLLYFAQEGNYEFVSAAYEAERDGSVFRVPHDHHRTKPIGGVQTWLYRSYLAGFKANPDCWRKRYDRVNDTDLAQRFRDAGVRIGHLNEVVAYVKPRPNEKTIGLKAYQSNERNTMERYAF